MNPRISTVSARLDDAAAMDAFLKPIPNAEQLCQVLASKEPVSTRAYDDATQTARFVESDGYIAHCFTVIEVTIDQAEMISIACEEMDARQDETFREAARRALQVL